VGRRNAISKKTSLDISSRFFNHPAMRLILIAGILALAACAPQPQQRATLMPGTLEDRLEMPMANATLAPPARTSSSASMAAPAPAMIMPPPSAEMAQAPVLADPNTKPLLAQSPDGNIPAAQPPADAPMAVPVPAYGDPASSRNAPRYYPPIGIPVHVPR
jgi:hypothetical protein